MVAVFSRSALLGLLLSLTASAEPSPTCFCDGGFHAFGSGSDATDYSQLYLPNHTYCFKDPLSATEDDTAGVTRPCGKQTASSASSANSGNSKPGPMLGSLSITVNLANRADCGSKIASFLAAAQSVIPSGATGPITEAESYCQTMFPLGGGTSQNVNLAVTFSFANLEDCGAKIAAAESAATSIQQLKNGALEEIGSPEAYCTSLFATGGDVAGVSALKISESNVSQAVGSAPASGATSTSSSREVSLLGGANSSHQDYGESLNGPPPTLVRGVVEIHSSTQTNVQTNTQVQINSKVQTTTQTSTQNEAQSNTHTNTQATIQTNSQTNVSTSGPIYTMSHGITFTLDAAAMNGMTQEQVKNSFKQVPVTDSYGNQTEATVNVFPFIVPQYSVLTVRVWGAGGGNLTVGGPSAFQNLIAEGGRASTQNCVNFVCSGTTLAAAASGGDINTPGTIGTSDGSGGSAPNGGAGANLSDATVPGGLPGGGGCGQHAAGVSHVSGSGSGAYVQKTYGSGDLKPGTTVTVQVGFSGLGLSGYGGGGGTPESSCASGGMGMVQISWQ